MNFETRKNALTASQIEAGKSTNNAQPKANYKPEPKTFAGTQEVKQSTKPSFLKTKKTGDVTDLVMLGTLLIALAGSYIAYRKLNQRTESRNSGGLASVAEAVEAYGYSYGRGGYLLGKIIDTEQRPWQKVLNKMNGENDSTIWLKLEDRFRMTEIKASIGSGKTTQFIIPQLLEDAASGIMNCFVIDRKPPELAAMTAAVWEDFDHQVIHFNPWIKEICWGFEPLFGATSDAIEAMVEVMVPISHVEDTTWLYRITDRDLVRTVFRAAQIWGKQNRMLATLPGVAELFRKGVMSTREAIESTNDKRLIEGINDLWTYPAGELAKMFRGLAGRFSFFIEDEDVARAFSRSDFTMRDLVTPVEQETRRRTILYVGASQSKGDRSRKIASLMTRLATIEAFKRGDEMRKHGKTWKDIVPLWMCLDERGTYYLPEDDDAIATFRSLGVAVTIALQSDKQLIKWQGKDAAEATEINFNFQVVLGGCDLEYATKISEEIGKHWVWVKSETKGRSTAGMSWLGQKSEGEGWRKVEELVLKPNEIMQLPDDEALIIGRKSVSSGRKCPPVRVKLYAYYKAESMRIAVQKSEQAFQQKCRIHQKLDDEGCPRKESIQCLPLPVYDWNDYLSLKKTKQPSDSAKNKSYAGGAHK